jgi:hypothetical protein
MRCGSFGAADLDLLEGLLNQHLGSPFFVKDRHFRLRRGKSRNGSWA